MRKIVSIASLLLVLPFSAYADWTLLNEESTLDYVSIKSSTVGEMNTFTTLSGSISEGGELMLDIDLASVETNIDIRNERMAAFFFETEKFAKATISGSVDAERAAALAVGEMYTDSVTLELSLHGLSKSVTSDVQVTKLVDEKLLVTSLKPVMLNAGDYGLAEGVEKLRDLAGLPSISQAVPVTYSLVFKSF